VSNYKFFLASFVWFLKLTYKHIFVFVSYKNPKNGKTYIQDAKFIYRKWYIYKERNRSIPTTYKVLGKKFKRSSTRMRMDYEKVLRILNNRTTFKMLIGLEKTDREKFDVIWQDFINKYKDGYPNNFKGRKYYFQNMKFYIKKGQIDI
jgi:hypothetical protein